MGRCAACDSERVRLFAGVRVSRPALAGIGVAVLATAGMLMLNYARHRHEDVAVVVATAGLEALIFYWAMAAVRHAPHEQGRHVWLWARVVAKIAIALGIVWTWAILSGRVNW